MSMSVVTWLSVVFCVTICRTSCSASAARSNDIERAPWLDNIESSIRNKMYARELYSRLRALNDAEEDAEVAHKRGFDFGLGRGFSASQAAKHKMGLEAAAFPSGPGRRRRSVQHAEAQD